jgi:hypothetical protein
MSGEKRRVDVEHIRSLRAQLRAVNNLDLDQIEFYENGKPLKVQPEAIEDWKFTGLNNADFIEFLDPETGLLRIERDTTDDPDQS